ncbi:hypothetical protein I4U23_000502 [Adineta vaga]|nr:hypothetical protein I4U23_000502 [Adineta vaga]
MDHQRNKTVLILDHGSFFARSSGVTFNVNVQNTDQQQPDEINNENTLGMKSLWTCVVECVLEYCRILFDIFEDDALITLIVTGIDQRDQSSCWNRYRNLSQCMDFFAGIQPPQERTSVNDDDLLKHSLNEAITVLCTRSKKQSIPSDLDYTNSGHIVVFSTFNTKRIETIERDLRLFHESHNHMALEVTDFVPLAKCDLTLMDIRSLDQTVPSSKPELNSVTSILHRTLYYSQAGQMLFTRMLQMLLKQHNLALTTVTGIPMKEDVASRSSLNYDVDIVHPAEVHDGLRERAPLKYWRQIKDDVETIVLKWSAFSYDPENYYDTYSAYRFSPLDVNSRESACLTNFLLSGKCVLLELGNLPAECTVNINEYGDEKSLNTSDIDPSTAATTTNRLFSHMIISHNQELMIHALAFGSNNPMSKIGPCYIVTDDKDNISINDLEELMDEIDDDVLEKDLRVDSFINVIRTTTLYPCDTISSGKIPIEDSLRLLERHTRRCPVIINETILFNLPSPMNVLISLILREKLSDDDVGKCLMALKHIDKMERNGEILPVPNNFPYTTKIMTAKAKKDEAYRYLWREIEYFVRGYKETSDGHRHIYQNILERRKSDYEHDSSSVYPSTKIDFVFPTDESSSNGMTTTTKREKTSHENIDKPNGRVWSEFTDLKQVLAANSLRDMWNRKQQEKRAPEFDGRNEHPPPRIIPLYVNLNTKPPLGNPSNIPITSNLAEKNISMSFERINLVLKQISSSNSYSSIQSLIEQYFFDKTLQLTSLDQEKLVRLCLRKLSDWFLQNPEQIKEIKIKFHQHLLQTPFLLKQKQLIDLILNENQTNLNDYFIFLLNDIYEKNYQNLLNELENDSDVAYIIHLPDRIGNISMTNIPLSFQTKTYFNRLSDYIQEQLITYHYPKMVAQMDTNVSFLCRLVHKAAKLGHTEYIWRRLYKNLFLKKSPNDSLWLRLTQYFLLETIDDVLLYTIQHGNAQILDLILSDRILHHSELQTYLTDTLLFRKQLSINLVRTILIYLTMSSNRLEQCFEKTFVRFLQLWSQESFIRFSSNEQHFYICQCICICLALNQQIHLQEDKDQILLCILNGIRIHLESTFDYIQRRGQFLGELIIERIDLFSKSNQLQFNTYDKNHPEIEILRKLAELNHSYNDRELSDDDEQQEIPKKKETSIISTEKVISSSNTVILHEVSNDEDDDSEFESYDYSHDKEKSEVAKPSYIRSCLADLIATDKVPQLEGALQILPSLIEFNKIECEEVALEISRILLNYNSTFNIENFQELQLNGLVTLCKTYPILISDYLCRQFYERNYTLNQRSLILKTIQETAKPLIKY